MWPLDVLDQSTDADPRVDKICVCAECVLPTWMSLLEQPAPPALQFAELRALAIARLGLMRFEVGVELEESNPDWQEKLVSTWRKVLRTYFDLVRGKLKNDELWSRAAQSRPDWRIWLSSTLSWYLKDPADDQTRIHEFFDTRPAAYGLGTALYMLKMKNLKG